MDKVKEGFFILVFSIIVLLSIYTINSYIITKKSGGYVSLTFDDGLYNDYLLAYPLMKKYGYSGTLYMIANQSDFFEGKKVMTFDEAKVLQDNGWEIGSHSLNHKNLVFLSDDELKTEIVLSKKILNDNGFDVNSLSLPFGEYNKKVIREAQEYYSSVRLMKVGFNNLNSINLYGLKSVNVKTSYSPEDICSLIKHAQKRGFWLILNFHNIDYFEKTLWDESIDDFSKILECINESHMKVDTISGVIETTSA